MYGFWFLKVCIFHLYKDHLKKILSLFSFVIFSKNQFVQVIFFPLIDSNAHYKRNFTDSDKGRASKKHLRH